jgi:hypothetical protein
MKRDGMKRLALIERLEGSFSERNKMKILILRNGVFIKMQTKKTKLKNYEGCGNIRTSKLRRYFY